jgi:hypothetical protein
LTGYVVTIASVEDGIEVQAERIAAELWKKRPADACHAYFEPDGVCACGYDPYDTPTRKAVGSPQNDRHTSSPLSADQ